MFHIPMIVAACVAIGSIAAIIWRRIARAATDKFPSITVSQQWLQEHRDGQRD